MRINHRYILITHKVLHIEGQNTVHIMNCHSCNQPSIMCALSANSVMSHYPFPLILQRNFRKQSKKLFQCVHLRGCLLNREAQSIFCHRSSSHSPELHKILEGNSQTFLSSTKNLYGTKGDSRMRMMWLNQT